MLLIGAAEVLYSSLIYYPREWTVTLSYASERALRIDVVLRTAVRSKLDLLQLMLEQDEISIKPERQESVGGVLQSSTPRSTEYSGALAWLAWGRPSSSLDCPRLSRNLSNVLSTSPQQLAFSHCLRFDCRSGGCVTKLLTQ